MLAVDFPQEEEGTLGWHIDPKDKDPRPEEKRQIALLRDLHMLFPAVRVFAVPNAAKRSRWEAAKAKREGMKRGALDLVLHWEPRADRDRGVAFIEMKNGTEMPSPDQVDELNSLWRQGHQCGVFRQERSALRWLRAIGAPCISGGLL